LTSAQEASATLAKVTVIAKVQESQSEIIAVETTFCLAFVLTAKWIRVPL